MIFSLFYENPVGDDFSDKTCFLSSRRILQKRKLTAYFQVVTVLFSIHITDYIIVTVDDEIMNWKQPKKSTLSTTSSRCGQIV